MLATIGDLVEDVTVHLGGPIRHAADTAATITRRRGGSAANVAAAAARLGHPGRFLGRVGADPIGSALVAELHTGGVDTRHVQRHGTSGTIVVLVDERGERSMLTDRGACLDLDEPDPDWLDGVTTIHAPLYSFSATPLAATTEQVIAWAHVRGVTVAIDLSSTSLIDEMGPDRVRDVIGSVRPHVVFANEDEAATVDLRSFPAAITVVKRGPEPVIVGPPDREPVEVAVPAIGRVVDTTGAGDAFAAGFLTAGTEDPAARAAAGCRSAHRLLASR